MSVHHNWLKNRDEYYDNNKIIKLEVYKSFGHMHEEESYRRSLSIPTDGSSGLVVTEWKRARDFQQFVMQHSSCNSIKQAPWDTTKQLGTVDMRFNEC